MVPGDGFYDLGSPTSWRDHFLTEYTFKGDLTNFFSEKNKFKTGFEMRFQNMQMVDIYRALGETARIRPRYLQREGPAGGILRAGQRDPERHAAQLRFASGLLGTGKLRR
ncbi:MAG: hypothetical protein MZV64_31545 [Ignavibacteriales bacterium]|nr:hypothetical protein [Ignavibacteriales bacterium]